MEVRCCGHTTNFYFFLQIPLPLSGQAMTGCFESIQFDEAHEAIRHCLRMEKSYFLKIESDYIIRQEWLYSILYHGCRMLSFHYCSEIFFGSNGLFH